MSDDIGVNLIRGLYKINPEFVSKRTLPDSQIELSSWPINYENGIISIPTEVSKDGKSISLSELIGNDAFSLLMRHVGSVNELTKTIRSETTVTRNPELVMREPDAENETWRFIDRLGWASLRAGLEAAGAKVSLLKRDNSMSDDRDSVWTRDRWIVSDNRNIYSDGEGNFDLRKREVQQAIPRRLEEEIGVTGKQIQGFLEGGDVIQHHKSNTVFVGIGMPRSGKIEDNASDLETAKKLANELKMDLVVVPRVKENYYHLDTFMASLPDGSIIIIPDATTESAVNDVRRIAGDKILELKPHESDDKMTRAEKPFIPKSLDLATNIFTINGNVFSTANLPEIGRFVEDRGYKYRHSYFSIYDSGPRCQINMKEKQEVDIRNDISMRDGDDKMQMLLASINFRKPESISLDSDNFIQHQSVPSKNTHRDVRIT